MPNPTRPAQELPPLIENFPQTLKLNAVFGTLQNTTDGIPFLVRVFVLMVFARAETVAFWYWPRRVT